MNKDNAFKAYLVGGAVRDKLLGLEVKDRDWVVVGQTIEHMLALGFQAVGKTFPVFIHPDSKEEYALARRETKTGAGYTGFDCIADPSITLEEDLLRRDLTINAIAEDSQGLLIDPYQGLADIEQKILRHVSSAFVEDPLRVLRVARFQARFYHLGFSIAAETLELMQKITESGELSDLAAERIWQETEQALLTKNAEQYFLTLFNCGALAQLMPELLSLFEPSADDHSSSITTTELALGCLNNACQLTQSMHESDKISIRFAAFCQNIPSTGYLTTDAKKASEQDMLCVNSLCKRLKIPKHVSQLSSLCAQWLPSCEQVFALKASAIYQLLKQLDVFRQAHRLPCFLLAAQAHHFASRPILNQSDQLNKPDTLNFPQANYLQACFESCRDISVKDLGEQSLTLKGKAIGEAIDKLREDRIAAVVSAEYKRQH